MAGEIAKDHAERAVQAYFFDATFHAHVEHAVGLAQQELQRQNDAHHADEDGHNPRGKMVFEKRDVEQMKLAAALALIVGGKHGG